MIRSRLFGPWLVLGAALLALAGCGGGGDDDKPSNRAPTASFTATPSVGQVPFTVTVNAAASTDPDGSITSYSWSFGDGGTGTGVNTTHQYTTAGTFTITLTVTDNRGATATATQLIGATVGPPPASVKVSGRITFERVPFAAIGDGLDYVQTFEAPAREVEVELLPGGGGAALATTATDQEGRYSFDAPLLRDVRIRAKALSRFAGTAALPATWDIRVQNNTNSNALYVLDGSTFNTGTTAVTRNLKATTGWGGGFAGYTGPRAAAPFAVLDTLYSAVQFVVSNRGGRQVQLPALDVFWSVDNLPSSDWNPPSGEILTTLYQSAPSGFPSGIYVLGKADLDTDEFDQHVLAHEFQHFLEDAVSRTDTVGGEHSLSDRLDMRVSFSEGFSNAFSAMVLDDPVYRDSFGDGEGDDFRFSVESDQFTNPGWYSESSVQRISWDLFDAANDAADADALTLGFAPMYAVMVDVLRDGSPLTSLFSFLTALKLQEPLAAAAIDDRVNRETNIVSATMDAYATTETHSGVSAADSVIVLPIYTDIALDGPAKRLCTDTTVGTYNKIGNRRFLRFNMPSAGTITVRVECPSSDVSCAGLPTPDPDFVLSKGRSLWFAEEADPRVEQLNANVSAGDHVLEIYEFSHVAADGDRRGRTCMTVSIN